MSMLATVHQPLSHNPALSILAGHLGEPDSVLREELAHCGVLAVHLSCEAEIWIGVDQRTRPRVSANAFKVLVVLEPPDVCCFDTDGFDLVLTWQEEHLRNVPQALLFVPATPWLLPDEWMQLQSVKCPGLGFLRGEKRRTAGHRLRHELWEARKSIAEVASLSLDFVAGGVDRQGRNQQFMYEFVLVVENSRHANYFSEKLLDALLCRCVPIYWGCTNVSDFFDAAGVIEVGGRLEDVAVAISSISPEDYACRAEAIARNCAIAASYAGDFGRRLESALTSRIAEAQDKPRTDMEASA